MKRALISVVGSVIMLGIFGLYQAKCFSNHDRVAEEVSESVSAYKTPTLTPARSTSQFEPKEQVAIEMTTERVRLFPDGLAVDGLSEPITLTHLVDGRFAEESLVEKEYGVPVISSGYHELANTLERWAPPIEGSSHGTNFPILHVERTTSMQDVEILISTVVDAGYSIGWPFSAVEFGVAQTWPGYPPLESKSSTLSRIQFMYWNPVIYERNRSHGPTTYPSRIAPLVHLRPKGIDIYHGRRRLLPSKGCPEVGPTVCLNGMDREKVLTLLAMARRHALDGEHEQAGARLDQVAAAFQWGDLVDRLTPFATDPTSKTVQIMADPKIPLELWVRAADILRYRQEPSIEYDRAATAQGLRVLTEFVESQSFEIYVHFFQSTVFRAYSPVPGSSPWSSY